MNRLPFGDQMYLAFLEGRKTQTRRLVPVQLLFSCDDPETESDIQRLIAAAPYKPGEIVAVTAAIVRGPRNEIRYRANGELASHRDWMWSSKTLAARYCPLWCSRHTARIDRIRVEHVQDITEVDAQREGWNWVGLDMASTYDPVCMHVARRWFLDLWDTIHQEPYNQVKSNPLVYVYEFAKLS